MMKIAKFAVAATVSLIALQSVAAMAQTDKTRYDVKSIKAHAAKTAYADFSISLNKNQFLHIDSADFSPTKGDTFSVCSSSSCDSSSKTKKPRQHSDMIEILNRAPSWGSGTVVVHAPADKTCAAGKHIPEVSFR
jgi:hypothetical protein